MDKNNKDKKQKKRENEDLDYEGSFFERLTQENVMPDGMISEIDETDFISMLLAEKSAIKPFIADSNDKDLAP